jgi:hypothetical protein
VAEQHLDAKAEAMQLPNLDYQIYSSPTNPKLIEAWRVTGALLTTMNREVRSHGAEFWIVSLWTSQQVSPDPVTRRQFCRQMSLTNLSYPDLWMQALTTKEQIPLILLAPRIAAYTQEHKVFVNGGVLMPPGTGHFNELGHRLAGNLIASELCAKSTLLEGSPNADTEQAEISCPVSP